MLGFSSSDGGRIVSAIVGAIQRNKQYLSDLDGAVGDGDHGINMNKGVTLCAEELKRNPGDLSHSLMALSRALMTQIGGAMGPLYGQFFRGMAKACEGSSFVDAAVFGKMLEGAQDGIQRISDAKIGDKTMMDVLIPSAYAYKHAVAAGNSFKESLEAMRKAAVQGRDSTRDLVAKVGRSSRLGERSRGALDAGAVSCCLVLESIAELIETL